jgi:GT2 family glycosyltransferase
MNPRKVSIILINYNSHRFTYDCVDSIREKTSGVDYEIVIVDNNSQPADYKALQPIAEQPRVQLIHSRINLGFSGGNMLGVQAADSDTDYYYFLNNDCVLRTDVCTQLAAFMDNTPDAGLCGAQMFDGKGSRQITFGYLPTLASKLLGHGFTRLFHPELYPPTKQVYTEPIRVPFVMGSTLFVRASAFNLIGGFDVAHFLYVEEEDLAKRLLQKDFWAYLVPQAEYIHFTGQSTSRNYDVEKEYYISLFHYFRKYHSWPARALFRAYYFIKNLKKFRRDRLYVRLAWFIGRGSPMRESLRYRQTIR